MIWNDIQWIKLYAVMEAEKVTRWDDTRTKDGVKQDINSYGLS